MYLWFLILLGCKRRSGYEEMNNMMVVSSTSGSVDASGTALFPHEVVFMRMVY